MTEGATNSGSRRLIQAFATAILIFVIAIFLPKLIISNPIDRIMITQALELGLSVLAIAILGKRRFAEYGFCRPKPGTLSLAKPSQWLLPAIMALTVGAVATIAILATGAVGNPIMRQLTLPQIVLFVWILSSTIEEVFTRGFLQGHLSSLSDTSVRLLSIHIELPALISAAFFACMHLVLILSGVDLATIVIILLFTFSLGLLAAHQRARTGSLLPAIGLHMLGNIGGLIGGIVFNVARFIISGKLPG